MITLISSALTGPTWKAIDLGNNDSIEIAIKRPTLDEQLAALEQSTVSSQQEFWLRSYVCDWRGVNDIDGKPVPFNWDGLNLLCAHYPGAIWGLLTAVRSVRSPEVGDDSKNSGSPSLAGGTTATTETTSTTEPSTLTAISAESGDSPATSD